MVKVSIIVSTDEGNNLDKCLESIFNQTLSDTEILVIYNELDSKLVDEYKEKYKNIIFINNKKNKAKNECIKKATGEYITFIDSNDYLEKSMLETFYNYAKKYEMDMVTGLYYNVKGEKQSIIDDYKFKIGNIKTSPQILFLTNYELFAKIYKKKMLIENNITFDEKETYDNISFISKVLLYSKLIGQIYEPLYFHHCNINNIDDKAFDIFATLKRVLEYYKREYYLKEEINYVVIKKMTECMLNQKHQKDKNQRNEFINYSCVFLKDNIKNWKKNKYYKKEKISKRIIKNHKKILKMYCSIHSIFKKNK